MAGFLYSVLLKLLDPTLIGLALLIAAGLLRRRRTIRRLSYALGLAILLVCGNGSVVRSLTHRLESQHPAPEPIPAADAILVLSGGIHARTAPRPTVEVGEGGDRVLYGAELFRRGHAPQIICTGNVGTGRIALRAEAEDMADLLVMVGVPRSAIVLETAAQNTHEHAVNLCPMFQERGIKRVLLVTSAIHMPRSIGVFRRSCPTVEYVPAPTDFRAVEPNPAPWYYYAAYVLPTPHNLADFSNVAHEYLGLLYYTLRGWV
jgi:uncharacterized SAM-binding protein YcdF (DUF218 family)